MPYGSRSAVDPAIAGLAHALTAALENHRSHTWRKHVTENLSVTEVSRMSIIPVTTLNGLTEVVLGLLRHLRGSRGGSGVIILPDDVPMSCVADLVGAFVDYGVTIETTRDVEARAKGLKERAEIRKARVRARWQTQRSHATIREA